MPITLLCGKICSGKSYAAEKYAEKENAVILSVDELMLALHGECLGENHRAAEKKCLDFLLKKAAELSKLGVNVIIDYGFGLLSDRDYARQYLSDREITAEWYYLTADDAVRKERLDERNSRLSLSPSREYIITEEMMARFDLSFEEPDNEESESFFDKPCLI